MSDFIGTTMVCTDCSKHTGATFHKNHGAFIPVYGNSTEGPPGHPVGAGTEPGSTIVVTGYKGFPSKKSSRPGNRAKVMVISDSVQYQDTLACPGPLADKGVANPWRILVADHGYHALVVHGTGEFFQFRGGYSPVGLAGSGQSRAEEAKIPGPIGQIEKALYQFRPGPGKGHHSLEAAHGQLTALLVLHGNGPSPLAAFLAQRVLTSLLERSDQ
jgi:hypothetical protein